MSDHRRDGKRPVEEHTVPNGRPLTSAEAAPDAIFDRFVANAYGGAPPGAGASPTSTLEREARWIATVEELLEDDGGVTEVGARPNLRAPDAPAPAPERPEPPTQDTDVTRAVVHPTRAGGSRPPLAAPVATGPLAAAPVAPPLELASSELVTARHKALTLTAPAVTELPAGPAALPLSAPALVGRAPLAAPAVAPAPVPEHEHTLRIVLLNKRKAPTVPPPPAEAPARQELESPHWQSVVRAPSTTTQRREALLVVPEVAKIEAAPSPMPEGSEDGMMPGGELDRKLGDMAVLLRYGHEVQVRREIDALQAQYPRDLLMLRRIAEFWIATGRPEPACELLFSLATGLFERRNVEGMRQALEQVLVLDPKNERALRLVALLEQRPGARDR